MMIDWFKPSQNEEKNKVLQTVNYEYHAGR